MPAPIRWVVRGLQRVAGRPVDVCADKLVRGLARSGPGLALLDRNGEPTPTLTALHDAAREDVAARVRAVCHAGGRPPLDS